jgi:hypothetical protein
MNSCAHTRRGARGRLYSLSPILIPYPYTRRARRPRLAAQELNDRRLTLCEGSALSERDLVRTRAEAASAVLLLADRFSPSVHHEDLSIQFQARPPPQPYPVCLVLADRV